MFVGLFDPTAFVDDYGEEPKYVNLQLNRENQWLCRRILVTDGKDGEIYVFNINQWIIATPEIDRHNAIAARPAELRYVRSPPTVPVIGNLQYYLLTSDESFKELSLINSTLF